MYAPDSIELLQKSGIDFQRHEEIGIEPNDFAELLITSGLVCSEDVKWISFHRYVRPLSRLALDGLQPGHHSGYDFGYILKILSGAPLPSSEEEFFNLLYIWFPAIFDVKYMIRSVKVFKGGLQDMADEFGVRSLTAN